MAMPLDAGTARKIVASDGLANLSGSLVMSQHYVADKNAEALESMAQNTSEAIKLAGSDIAASNFAISKSILNASSNILFGINRIADEMERQNKLNEYYMLQKEITDLENELIEMQLIKRAYEEMTLSKIPNIELDDKKIATLVYLYTDSGLQKLKEVSLSNLISPFEVFNESITKKTHTIITCIAKTDSSYYNIWDPGFLTSLCYKIEELGIIIPEKWISGSETNVTIGEKIFHPKEEPGNIYLYMRQMFITIFRRVCGKAPDLYNIHYKGISEGEIREINNLLSKVGTFTFVIPREHITKLFKDIYEQLDPNIVNRVKVLEFKAFIDSLNQNIDLNNLRSLHQELHNKVREYKMEQLF